MAFFAFQAYPGLKPHLLTTIQVATQIPGILLEPLLLEMMGLRNLTILCSAIQVLGYACMGGVPIFWVNETPMAVYIGNGLVGFTAGRIFTTLTGKGLKTNGDLLAPFSPNSQQKWCELRLETATVAVNCNNT